MQALESTKPKPFQLIAFQTIFMDTEERKPRWHDPVTHGSKAAIFAAIFAGIATIAAMGSCYVNWQNRADQKDIQNKQKTTEQFNRDVNSLIDTKLGPAVTSINDSNTQKLAPITNDLSTLKSGMVDLKARMEQLNTDLNRSTKLQLDKLSFQIKSARQEGKIAEVATLRDIGYDLLSLSGQNGSNAKRANQVANELLGYYSFSFQADSFIKAMEQYGIRISGTNRSQECIRSENPGVGTPNVFLGDMIWENCTIHLDNSLAHSVVFERTIFRNVTVVYAGGHVILNKVAFVDCTFEFAANEPSRKLGETLLAEAHVEKFETP